MNNLRTKFGLCGMALWMATACAWAGIVSPLYVGNLVPVLDQNGQKLVGSNRSAEAAQRSRVEVRTTTDGSIRPPMTNGAADPSNPLLTPNSVGGIGMNTATTNSGIFCMVFPDRPAHGTKIFARAYNAPTLAEASFYADSQIAMATSNGTSLVLTFGAAQPLDPGDADGDGLNNSWEKALGIADRPTSDYDGDGMSDLQELLAGTDPKDASSALVFRFIQEETATSQAKASGTQPVRVRFQSVPGKSYQLQFAPTLLGAQTFENVGAAVTAAAGETESEILAEVPAGSVTGSFRISLVK